MFFKWKKTHFHNNNKIIIHTQEGKLLVNPKLNINIKFLGSNNLLEIYEPFLFERYISIIFYSDNARIILNKCRLVDCSIEICKGGILSVDEGSSVGGNIHMLNEENLKVSIGKNCMFSKTELWPTDGHQVTDIYGNCINCGNLMGGGIVIGNHVWLGYNSLILKNVHIADNTIVAAGSVVTKSFNEENIIIAGNPAKKVKEKINWNRKAPK